MYRRERTNISFEWAFKLSEMGDLFWNQFSVDVLNCGPISVSSGSIQFQGLDDTMSDPLTVSYIKKLNSVRPDVKLQ
jgi:hypothetical protein